MINLKIKYREINEILDRILKKSFIHKPDLVIGIMDGSKYIIKYIKKNYAVDVAKIIVHSYKNNKTGNIFIQIPEDTKQKIINADIVYIFDEIYDTGLTIRIVNNLIKSINNDVKIKRFVLYSKQITHYAYYGKLLSNFKDTWIEFPWEKSKKHKK